MSSLTWLIGVTSTNILLHICYCVLDIPVSILVVLNLVKTRGFETFHSTISSNIIIEFDGAAARMTWGLLSSDKYQALLTSTFLRGYLD